VVSLTEKKKTIERYDALLASLQKQVDDAYKSGIVMKNDLLKVKLKRNKMLLNKSKLENGIALASMAFCQHIGIPYDSTLVLNDTLATGGIPESYYVDHSAALATRAEYGLLKAMVRSEEVQTRMKIGDYLPQVGVGVSGMSMKFDDGKARTFGMVFGTLSIPISDWWGAAHTLSERKVKEEMAENTMKDNAELLLLQMEKSRQDLSDAYKQVLLSEEAKAQAEENLKVNYDSYRNGVSSVSDLLEAQALVQQTVDHFTEAKSNYLMKKIMYLQATGR
ncbi:MAG TPA: TolC family protein, partial [Bacteroidota bacterium]|nr:TolC family protein [Bacteroidota bacterium]